MTDIRPMNFGEILDAALVIYRRHFGLFLKLAVIVLAVPVVLLVYVSARFLGSFMTQAPSVTGLLLFLPVGILGYLGSLVLTAGTIRIIADSYLGRTPRLQDALSLGIAKLWALVVVGLGKGVVVFLAAAAAGVVMAILGIAARGTGAAAVWLLIAAGAAGAWLVVFVLCGYAVTTPVVVLEELGSSFDSFGRSWDLTRSFKLKVLGLGVVALLLFYFLPSWVLQLLSLVARASSPALSIALGALATVVPILLAPALAAVITLMYYDLRVRREAFDLQILSRQLGIV